MGPGFKYHIVSISAIFFALTIGLVVGSVFVSPQFANRQERAIRLLQQTLNTDIAEKGKEIDQYRECVSTISPLALKGRFGSAAVAVIQTGDYPDAASRASDAIELASPGAIVHIAVTPNLDRTSEDVRNLLEARHSADHAFPGDRDALFQTLGLILQRGDSQSDSVLTQLEREGLIRLTPEDKYALPVKFAVIVTGSRSPDSLRAARIDVPLARALIRQGISVVVCESRDVLSSDVPSFRVLGDELSTVDNIDMDIGRCALVLAFSGPRGDYGVGLGASHLLPPLPEQQ